MASGLEDDDAVAADAFDNRPVIPRGNHRAPLLNPVKRTVSLVRARFETVRSRTGRKDNFQDLQSSVNELRDSIEALGESLITTRQTTDGHAAWLLDLQTWMSSCVQVLNTLADVPPIPSARIQSTAPPARRRDDVEEIKRRVNIWTTMAWLDHAVVPRDRLISVIMPTRNRCAWIGRAIESILAQTYENWELVVVDDDSSDDTALLLTEAAAGDERIRYVQIEHAGTAAARNVALDRASGDIICYLDDDNVMHPGWLKAVAWAFSSWPQTEILYGARIIEDDMARDGARSGNMPSIRFRAWNRRRLESSNYIDQNVIAHRAGLSEARFDEALPMEDWDLMLRMTARRQPLELPVFACLYSTTAPNRESEQRIEMDALHEMRARAHLGRPLRLLALGRRPEEVHVGRIDADLSSFVDEGAYVCFADSPHDASKQENETESSRVLTAVKDHDPDVVLVYGTDTAADLYPSLEASGRPFAVRITDGNDRSGAAELVQHPLLLGLWNIPENNAIGSAADFLVDLAERLRIWKLDIPKD